MDNVREEQDEGAAPRPRRKVVKKVVKVKKSKAPEVDGEEDEGRAEGGLPEEKKKKKKKKVVVVKKVKKVKKKKQEDGEEGKEDDLCEDGSAGEAKPKKKVKKKVVKKVVVKRVKKKNKEPSDGAGSDGPAPRGAAEGKDECDDDQSDDIGFAARNMLGANLEETTFEAVHARGKIAKAKARKAKDGNASANQRARARDGDGGDDGSSDGDHEGKSGEAVFVKTEGGGGKGRAGKEKAPMTEARSLEEDLVEEDLDPGLPSESKSGGSRDLEDEEAKDEGAGMLDNEVLADDTCYDGETEAEYLSRKYVEEFASVQNQDQDMADRILKLRDLLYSPVPDGVTFKCQIDRHYDNTGMVYYSFILPTERRDGLRDKRMTLMIAKARSGMHLRPTYVISLEPVDFRKRCNNRSERYFGKLQLCSGGDLLGLFGLTQYALFDDGYNPSKVSSASPPVGYARKELLSVVFCSSRRTPEDLKMSVAKPEQSEEAAATHRAAEASATITENHHFSVSERVRDPDQDVQSHPYLAAAEDAMTQIRTIPIGSKKRPAMSEESRFPVAPSVKNFELGAHPVKANSTPCMGMVRIGRERFFVVTRYPFSPFEAFGIALAKFDATSTYRARMGRRL